MIWSLVTATWALYPWRNPRRVGMIRDCGSVMFATVFGRSVRSARRWLLGCTAAAPSAAATTRRARMHPGAVVHRHRRATHRFPPGGGDRGVPVEVGLVGGDLAGQVRSGLGQPMRPVRDPPDHRLALLGTASTRQRGLLAFRGPASSLGLRSPARGRGADPLARLVRSTRPAGTRSAALLAVLVRPRCPPSRSVASASAISPLTWSLEPVPTPVGVDRGVRGDLRPVDGDRAEPGQPASPAISSTCANRSVNASPASARNRAIVEWSGVSWAHNTRNATSVVHNRSICRDDRTPWQ